MVAVPLRGAALRKTGLLPSAEWTGDGEETGRDLLSGQGKHPESFVRVPLGPLRPGLSGSREWTRSHSPWPSFTSR